MTESLRLLNLRATLAAIQARATVAKMRHPVEMVSALDVIEHAAEIALKDDDAEERRAKETER